MSRCPIVCVFPDGTSFHCPFRIAQGFVANGDALWDGARTVRMQHHDRPRGLSLRVGEELAVAVYKSEAWAKNMLGEIQRGGNKKRGN
jgi:hypothetical protein